MFRLHAFVGSFFRNRSIFPSHEDYLGYIRRWDDDGARGDVRWKFSRGRSFSIPVAREIRVDLRANYSSLFVAGAFQSRARRERLRGRNLVPEIAMYPVGQVPGPCSVRGKVIKAFVFPVHCRSNFVALQHWPRSNRNFESYSSPYPLRREFVSSDFPILFSHRSKSSFSKALLRRFCFNTWTGRSFFARLVSFLLCILYTKVD